ncbi:MAG: enoyl-CoA hydratase/isomerase family protein [Myxococcota bacterium]
MAAAETPGIRSELLEDGRVLRILLDQPKGNVLTGVMMDALRAQLESHVAAPELQLVVIRGAGGNFSYGASVPEHQKQQAAQMLRSFHAMARSIAGCPVPVAALVEGKCLGGAFELALCCHLVFTSPNAVFACPEVKLGVFPPVLAALGAQRLGAPTAERLLLTGGELDARAAHALGWVSAILDGDPEQKLLEWYRTNLQPLSAFTLRQATRAMRVDSGWLAQFSAALEAAERRYVDHLLPSHDGNEGIDAFLARRPPQWRNA